MEREIIQFEKREQVGTGYAKKMRKLGKVPAVIYGANENHSILVDNKVMRKLLSKKGARNLKIVSLKGEAGSQQISWDAIVKDVDYDVVSDSILHVDFYHLDQNKMLRFSVPVLLTGISLGVRLGEGVMDQLMYQVDIMCYLKDFPGHLEFDVSHLKAGESLQVKDLEGIANVTLVSPAQAVLAVVGHVSKRDS